MVQAKEIALEHPVRIVTAAALLAVLIALTALFLLLVPPGSA